MAYTPPAGFPFVRANLYTFCDVCRYFSDDPDEFEDTDQGPDMLPKRTCKIGCRQT